MLRKLCTIPAHPSIVLVIFCAAMIGGVAFARLFGMGHLALVELIFTAVCLSVWAACKRHFFAVMALCVAVGFGLGFIRGSTEIQNRIQYERFQNRVVQVRGVVSEDVSYGTQGLPRYRMKHVTLEGNRLPGDIWVSLRQDEAVLKRGDSTTLTGYLSGGFGSFAASLTNANLVAVERTSSQDIGLVARDYFAQKTDGLISEPARSLGLGYLLGMKSSLPEELEQKIQLLGLTHVVVASGYNLTILVVFARRLFEKISKYLSALLSFGMIGSFIAVTGFSPSMSRAGLVAGLSILAWYYGRKIHPISLLLIAAAVTLMIKPAYLWGDIGWFLSFAAFYGILVLAPLLNVYFFGRDQPPGALRELLVSTLSAQIITLPIILYTFGIFSSLSLVANVLILPTIPFAMLATFISGLGGMIASDTLVAGLVSYPANLLLGYSIFVVDKVSSIEAPGLDFEISLWQLFALYGFIYIAISWLIHKTKYNFINYKKVVD